MLTNFTNKKNSSKLLSILGATVILLFPLYVYLFSFEDITTAQSLCPFKMTTGLPCPGCGITKSIASIYDGDIIQSFNYHIFGPFAFVFFIGLIMLLSFELLINKEFFRSIFYSTKIATFLAIILSIYHFIRIISFLKENNLDSILEQSIWF